MEFWDTYCGLRGVEIKKYLQVLVKCAKIFKEIRFCKEHNMLILNDQKERLKKIVDNLEIIVDCL